MRFARVLTLFAVLIVVAVAVTAVLTRERWQGWLFLPAQTAEGGGPEGGEHGHEHGPPDKVVLSPQAAANLRLRVEPLAPRSYWRTLVLPAAVAERRGRSDRTVTAPVAGVVSRLLAVPGDTVAPGQPLFVLTITSEPLLSTQTELYKNAQEIKITQNQKKALEGSAAGGAVPQARVVDLGYQLERLEAARKAYRTDLSVRGLSPQQIDRVEEGTFVKEFTLRAPAPADLRPVNLEAPAGAEPTPALYELEELNVRNGEQVQAGHALCSLADHQHLYAEGRGFKDEASPVARAAENGWPVEAEFLEESEADWKPLADTLTIKFLSNTVDPASQTFTFAVPLSNQFREYTREGKVYRLWRFRPGQRVRLGVRVEEFKGVFVVPIQAVVREGPEAYVFRQNGSAFQRRPVHVAYEDTANAVLSNDGSVLTGDHVALNAAAALNRALKALSSGGEGGHDHGHDHHGHSHEH